jgi:hypothetical protein
VQLFRGTRLACTHARAARLGKIFPGIFPGTLPTLTKLL